MKPETLSEILAASQSLTDLLSKVTATTIDEERYRRLKAILRFLKYSKQQSSFIPVARAVGFHTADPRFKELMDRISLRDISKKRPILLGLLKPKDEPASSGFLELVEKNLMPGASTAQLLEFARINLQMVFNEIPPEPPAELAERIIKSGIN